jgi:hypothetical protein
MDYEEVMKNRYNKLLESGDYNFDKPNLEDTPAPAAPAKPATSMEKGMEGAMQTAAAGGGAMDILQKGLMASGHPGGMAAGLGLAAANSIVQGRNKRAQDKYEAEVKKINARQEAINKMAMLGQGLRA